MANKAACAGLSALLNLCASEILEVNSTIYYLFYRNVYKLGHHVNFDLNEIGFAEEIASFFGYKLVVLGPYKCWIPPVDKRNLFYRIKFEKNNFKVDDGDVITSNVIRYLEPQLNGQSIEIFPEGASCFNRFVQPNLKLDELLRLRIRPYLVKNAKRLFGCWYKEQSYYILPDKGGLISDSISNCENVKVLSHKIFINRKKCATYFARKYEGIDFSGLTNPFFHPVIPELELCEYKNWFDNNISNLISDRQSTLVIKKHQNDNRDYTSVFKNQDVISIEPKFHFLPGEIFVEQMQPNYIGSLSTLLLSFGKDFTNIIELPNKNLSMMYRREYYGMIDILKLNY